MLMGTPGDNAYFAQIRAHCKRKCAFSAYFCNFMQENMQKAYFMLDLLSKYSIIKAYPGGGQSKKTLTQKGTLSMTKYKLQIVKVNGKSRLQVTKHGRFVCSFNVKTNFSFTIGHYSLILADSGACRAFLDNLSARMRDVVKNVWKNEAVWNEGFVVCAR